MYYSRLQLVRFVAHLRLLALEFRLQLSLRSMTSKLGSLERGSKIDAYLQLLSLLKLQLLQILKFTIIQLLRYVMSDALKLHLLIIKRFDFSFSIICYRGVSSPYYSNLVRLVILLTVPVINSS